MKNVIVSASSLPAGRNMSSQLEYIKRVQTYGADMYHLDIMDGMFVRNQSLDYNYFEQLKQVSNILFDVHLMINEPERFILKYIKQGADILTVHYEAFKDDESLIKVLKQIKSKKVLAGIAVDIDTDIKNVLPLFKYADVALIMGVKVGAYGQTFNEEALKKIKKVRQDYPDITIEIDGGMNDITAKKAIKAGADVIVSGAYIYNNDAFVAIQTLKGKY